MSEVIIIERSQPKVIEIATRGPRGPKGDAGPAGANGAPGAQGPQGNAGAQGAAGAEGPQGKEGPQGIQGIQGPVGPQGPQGPDGKGEAGDQGPEGPQGPQGEVGPQGAKGDQGPQGAQGAAGPEGKQGPEGKEGKQGPAGEGGAAYVWEDVVLGANVSQIKEPYAPKCMVGQNGDVAQLSGLIEIGGGGIAAGSTMLTLPVAARPKYKKIITLVDANNAQSSSLMVGVIEPDGKVKCAIEFTASKAPAFDNVSYSLKH